jgi:hypothetical protein
MEEFARDISRVLVLDISDLEKDDDSNLHGAGAAGWCLVREPGASAMRW